jgi:hypothetical protein
VRSTERRVKFAISAFPSAGAVRTRPMPANRCGRKLAADFVETDAIRIMFDR